MTGKFEYKKVCKFCGNTFLAQKSTTKFCSDTCANRGKKAKNRQERLRLESEEIREQNRQTLLSQEFLSISSAAVLLSISRPTIYKMIANGELKTIRISERIVRIQKSDLLNLHQNSNEKPAPINASIAEISKKQEEYVTVAEALQLFKISNTYLYNKIRAKQIPPVIIKGKAHYPKNTLQKIFAKKQYADISEWYTVAEITEKFGVSPQYVYEYTSDHKMPKKREGKTVFISKLHWDKSRGLDQTERDNYYSVPQATEKFGIGRSHLYDLIRVHKLPKIKRGQSILIHRQELDNIMNNRKK